MKKEELNYYDPYKPEENVHDDFLTKYVGRWTLNIKLNANDDKLEDNLVDQWYALQEKIEDNSNDAFSIPGWRDEQEQIITELRNMYKKYGKEKKDKSV